MQSLIAVVGAGIGGLAAALAFARQGRQVEIFEQSPALREVGAGLQLSPNATGLLDTLGLTATLTESWHEPEKLTLVSGTTLRPLAHIPFGQAARQRWSFPYAVIHRAELQRILVERVEEQAQCRLHLDAAMAADAEDRLATRFANFLGRQPDLIIRADGVWSQQRDRITGAEPARFTGHIAWRAVVSASDLSFADPADDVNAFLGPNTHLVTYPLGKTRGVNAVAITPGVLDSPEWDAAGDANELIGHFKGWNSAVIDALARLEWRFWPLFEARNQIWHAGSRIVLLGDAAHAMMPFAAQGAAMAIEDAIELATCFSICGGDAAATIAAYERVRQPRVAQVRKRGDFNHFAYHATGPVRLVRDLVLRHRSPKALAGDLDWIYGYRAGAQRKEPALSAPSDC